MMEALRLLWIISRYYNVDEKMIPLMERIVWELTERVTRVLHVRIIYNENSLAEVKRKTSEAKAMLQLWKSSYLQVRAKIESSGRDARWEFDRKRLFERTDYMSTICQDLFNVAEVLEEFHNIFGAEMVSVTGKRERVEAILAKVDRLVVPIQQCSFDPYAMKNSDDWKTVMSEFTRDVAMIEVEAKRFIDEAFKNLRSAEGAFDMIVRFKHVKSRHAINAQMMKKFGDILLQYDRQIDQISTIFQEHKEDPQLYKNQPPAGGSIIWEKSLFHRMKQTMLRFRTLNEMMESEMGRSIQAKYLKIGREMRSYSQNKHEHWYAETETSLPLMLKRNLLTAVSAKPKHPRSSATLPIVSSTSAIVPTKNIFLSEALGDLTESNGEKRLGEAVSPEKSAKVIPEITTAENSEPQIVANKIDNIDALKSSEDNLNRNNPNNENPNDSVSTSQRGSRQSGLMRSDSQSVRRSHGLCKDVVATYSMSTGDFLRDSQFVTDFDPRITEIIAEAKYMEQLGIPIPEGARSAALHELIYIQNVSMVKQMVTNYNDTLAMLTESDMLALEDHIKDLRKVIIPASKRMTWRTIGIQEFLAKCNLQIARFSSLVHGMQKNVADIEQRLSAIHSADLFKACPRNLLGLPPECMEYFDCIRKYRAAEMRNLMRLYKDIGYILLKIEGIVWDSSSGCCPKMHNYYAHWEGVIFNAITDMIISNLKAFNQSISGERALFQLEAVLVPPDIVLHPMTNEVLHSFIHYMNLYSASSRLLLRSAPDSSTAKKSSFKARVNRGLPSRMHEPDELKYGQKGQKVPSVPLIGGNCDLWCLGWDSKDHGVRPKEGPVGTSRPGQRDGI